MKQWSEKYIQQLAREGKIKGFSANKPRPVVTYVENGVVKQGHLPRARPAGLVWLDMNLEYWCKKRSITLEQEYRFEKKRRWRFDYAIPSMMIAVEYEGGIFMEKSGHTSASGVNRDVEKYTRAQVLGWTVIRATATSYKTVLKTLKQLTIEKE
ncbi:MAG TPA: hypothetical protein VK644_15035 [Chitinophagaceae bacterium]|nr:hypothetical protein [Chitinophagaceae bacterium]